MLYSSTEKGLLALHWVHFGHAVSENAFMTSLLATGTDIFPYTSILRLIEYFVGLKTCSSCYRAQSSKLTKALDGKYNML
jgi:hypothetical protein